MKILKTIFGLIVGMVIALASVMLIIWLIEAGTDAPAETVDAGEKEIDWILMAISIALSLLFCGVGIVVHTILHEAGHLLFGLATGYKFVSFRIFNRMIAKEKDGLKVRKFSIVGTMGQCVMEPPCHTEEVPYFWYNAGGVAMNILLTAVAILLLRSYDLEIIPMSALLMIAFTGMLMAVINGVPFPITDVSNDGRNILLLAKNKGNRRHFACSLLIVASLHKGVRLREMPKEWFDGSALSNSKDVFDITRQTLWLYRLEDEGKYIEAREIAEEMTAKDMKLSQVIRNEMRCEQVLLELLTENRREVVDTLWTKSLQSYVKATSKYSAGRLVVLYAYELLYNHDASTADTYRKTLEEKRHDFASPGDTITAIDICREIERKYQESITESSSNK